MRCSRCWERARRHYFYGQRSKTSLSNWQSTLVQYPVVNIPETRIWKLDVELYVRIEMPCRSAVWTCTSLPSLPSLPVEKAELAKQAMQALLSEQHRPPKRICLAPRWDNQSMSHERARGCEVWKTWYHCIISDPLTSNYSAPCSRTSYGSRFGPHWPKCTKFVSRATFVESAPCS